MQCHNCKQYYTGNMLSIMGNSCSQFAAEEYPTDSILKIISLGTRRYGIVKSGMATLVQRERVANDVLVAVREYYGDDGTSNDTDTASIIPEYILQEKQAAYNALGYIALERKDVLLAIQYFTICKDILTNSLGLHNTDYMVMDAQLKIVKAEAMLPNNTNRAASNEVIFQLQKSLYEKAKNDDGETSPRALFRGWNLAVFMCHSQRFQEARPLLENLHRVSLQVHGSDHRETKEIEGLRQFVEKKLLNQK
eukprot:scaffold25551_cov39-Cyclotella_meneghiniana.AAC.4